MKRFISFRMFKNNCGHIKSYGKDFPLFCKTTKDYCESTKCPIWKKLKPPKSPVVKGLIGGFKSKGIEIPNA